MFEVWGSCHFWKLWSFFLIFGAFWEFLDGLGGLSLFRANSKLSISLIEYG